MPGNIAQFTSPVNELHPQPQGEEALASAGVHVGRLYRQTGDDYQQAIDRVGAPIAKIVEQYDTMTEISQGSAALAAMHNNFTTQWNEMASKSDPNDKSIQGKFLNDTVEPQLQKFQDGFATEKGQDWALNQVDQMRMHYEDKTNADMSARAGNATIENMKTTLNNLSDVARKDPSSMDQSIGQIDALVNATKEHNTGLLTPEQINRIDDVAHDMKNEVVKSGIQGLADVNPKGAVAAINSGKFSDYITGTEGDTLTKYAEGVTRMKLEDQQRVYENQQRAQKQTDENAANKVLNSVYNPTTGQLSVPNDIMTRIWSAPGVSGKAKLEMLGAVKHISEDSSIDDATTVRNLYEGVGKGTTTQQDALSALGAGKITPKTYSEINNTIKGTDAGRIDENQYTQTMKDIKTRVSGEDQLPGVKDPKGEDNYASALPLVAKALRDGLQAGIPPSELYDPQNKNWIGNAAKPFIRSQQQYYTDLAAANLTANATPAAATAATNLDSKYQEDFKNGKLDYDALKADYKAGKVSAAVAKELAIASGKVSKGDMQNSAVPRPE